MGDSWKPLSACLPAFADAAERHPLPTESPIEERFAGAVLAHLAPEAHLAAQVNVATCAGRFRLDFVIQRKAFRVAVECDGRGFHSDVRDEWRDAVTLGDGCINSVVRFRGMDLHKRLEDCAYTLAVMYPRLFSERGRSKLKAFASGPAVDWLAAWGGDVATEEFHVPFDADSSILVRRRALFLGSELRRMHAFAVDTRIQDLTDLDVAWRNRPGRGPVGL